VTTNESRVAESDESGVAMRRLHGMLQNLSRVIDQSCVRTRVGYEYECGAGHRFFIALERSDTPNNADSTPSSTTKKTTTSSPPPSTTTTNDDLTFDDVAWSEGWAVLRACASTSSMRPRAV
jgi:hypothetical protein